MILDMLVERRDSIFHSIVTYPDTFLIVGLIFAFIVSRKRGRLGWAIIYAFSVPVAIYIAQSPATRPVVDALSNEARAALWAAAALIFAAALAKIT